MFGKNEVAGPRPASDGFLVKSIFYTIQGEGPWAGRPTIFVRLAKCNLRCHFCFPADTMIVMANGMAKTIVDVRKGEEVMSFYRGKFVAAPVKKLLKSEPTDQLVTITNEKTALHATPNHPIMTRHRGFVNAGEITKNDHLMVYNYDMHVNYAPKSTHNYNGVNMFASQTVESVRITSKTKIEKLAWGRDKVPVFNLSVPDTNTYIANGVVVHNCDTDFEEGEVFGIGDLADRLAALSEEVHCDHFVITGGEPMLQAIPRLMLHPKLLPKYFQIETAGTVWPLGMDDAMMHKHVTIVCSPKTPKVHDKIRKHAAAWKYIISTDNVSGEDGLPIYSTQMPGVESHIFRPWDAGAAVAVPIYVQPCDEQDAFKNHANSVAAAHVAMKYGYRLSIQMHKIVGVE